MFSGLIVQANKGQWVIVHESFPVKNCAVHKTMIELVVLERHPDLICKGNRDSSFINFSRKWTGSPIFYIEGYFIFADLHTQCVLLIFPITKPS